MFWHVGMFILYYVRFFKWKILKKIRSIRTIVTIITSKKQSQLSRNLPVSFRFVHSISPFLLSLLFLPSFSPVPPFIGFHYSTGMVTDWWVDSILRYNRQLTIFYVLSRQYNLVSWYTWSSPDLQLTSSSICSFPHVSPDGHPSLLSCRTNLFKTYQFYFSPIICFDTSNLLERNHCILYGVLSFTLGVDSLSRS